MIGIEKPTFLYLRKQLGTIPQHIADGLKSSENPAEYIKIHCQEKLQGFGNAAWVKMVYYEEYTELLRYFQYQQHILSLSVDDMLVLYRDRMKHTTNVSRAELAVRRYLQTQDINDLALVPETEINEYCSRVMEKVGDFWIPKEHKKRQGELYTTNASMIRDPNPSFSLYRICVYKQHVPVQKVTVLDKIDCEMIRIPAQKSHFMTNTTIKMILQQVNTTNKICFIANSIQDRNRLVYLPHWIYANVSIVQGYATCISRMFKRYTFEYYVTYI